MSRFINPIADLLTLFRLYRTFLRESFDIVHNIQIKPTILGAIAARLAGIPRVAGSTAGLGYPFFIERPNLFLKLLGSLVLRLLQVGSYLSDKIWFQNSDDLNFLVAAGIVPGEKAALIRGNGINVEEYAMHVVDASTIASIRNELGLNGSAPIVTMVVARLIWSKGVKEFLEAAQALRNRRLKVKFLLVGASDQGHPDSVTEGYLRQQTDSNCTVITHFREDIREILSISDVVALPSYFREGIPRVLLEALSLGKPIVTTDNPGCREVVDHGENGYLVPVRDSRSLADAIAALVVDESLRRRFGVHSRRKAQNEFDERIVINGILTKLYGFNISEFREADPESVDV